MLKSFWVIKKSWEMWRKALSNYSVYLGFSWWNIYITVMEVLRVIKLARRVSSLFPRFPCRFVKEKTNMWTKPLFLMMELLYSGAMTCRLSEWLFFYSILSVCHLYPFELECGVLLCRISLPRLSTAVVSLYATFSFMLFWFSLRWQVSK